MKNTIIKLGTITSITAPIVTVVSCQPNHTGSDYFFNLFFSSYDVDTDNIDILLQHLPLANSDEEYIEEYSRLIYNEIGARLKEKPLNLFKTELNIIYSSSDYFENNGRKDYTVPFETEGFGIGFGGAGASTLVIPSHIDDDGVLIHDQTMFVRNVDSLYTSTLLEFVNHDSLLTTLTTFEDPEPKKYTPEGFVTKLFILQNRIEVENIQEL